jgi:hypothetical protein
MSQLFHGRLSKTTPRGLLSSGRTDYDIDGFAAFLARRAGIFFVSQPPRMGFFMRINALTSASVKSRPIVSPVLRPEI